MKRPGLPSFDARRLGPRFVCSSFSYVVLALGLQPRRGSVEFDHFFKI